jgi:3',5'-cyclic AMP phosphodiesterase CpdA
MTSSISWVHIGDLHMDEADGWQSRDRLAAIVAELNAHVGGPADFVFLPGDNANHATAEQYRVITDTLASLLLPWRVIPGDHDFETGVWSAMRRRSCLPIARRARSLPATAVSSSISSRAAPADPISA